MKKDRKVEGDEIVIAKEASVVTKRYSLEFAQGQLENINKEIAEYVDRLVDARKREEYRSEIVDHVTPIIQAKKDKEEEDRLVAAEEVIEE